MKKVYVIGVLLAVLAGFAVYLFASELQASSAPVAIQTAPVVVSTVDIPAETLITADMVALKDLPEETVHADAALKLENVVGSIAVEPIVSGEQVLTERLAVQGEGANTLSYELEKGHRAISVAVDEVTGISGFINAGDHVDVVATIIYPKPEGEQTFAISTMLVENVLVVKTGLVTVDKEDTKDIYQTVTLSVIPDDALKINYAASNGSIRLILRPVLDDKLVKSKDFPVISGAMASAGPEA